MNSFNIDYSEVAYNLSRQTGIRCRPNGKELIFTKCPYCGKEKKFSINKDTGQFQCFRASCGVKGNIYKLAEDFNLDLGRDANEYFGVGPRRHYRIFKKQEEPIKPKSAAIKYLESRGIHSEIAEKYQITTDKKGNLIFPFFDQDEQLQFIKYRNPHPKEGQNKEWCEKDCKPILFGMSQCNLDNDTLIVTEGQIDSLSVAQAGYENAVSVPTGARGFSWVPFCWDWMSNFKKIIVFGDHEHDEITLFSEISSRWGNRVWHVQAEDYLDCKDANEILQKYGSNQIKKCIENAVQLPIRDAIELSSVEYINPYEIPKVATGINSVDELLCGGLPLGQMILLTGKAGDGKSTFASQLLVSAIDQGYKVFAYSGELPNYVFKSWIDLQAAGDKNIDTNQGKWGLYSTVKPDVLNQINGWYKGRAWLYDNRIQSFEEEQPEGLIKLLENVIQQYGVNVILLDNLMTGLDLEKNLGEDKYERQSLFVKMLIRIALQYNVLILLVAHKRKTYGSSDVNESVSGSLDIINLASIVLSYEAVTQTMIEKNNATKEDRVLKVTKNRLFGNVNTYGFIMHYSPISKRVYMSGREKAKQYTWKMYEESEVEEFPFK